MEEQPQNKSLLVVAGVLAVLFLFLLIVLVIKKQIAKPGSVQSPPSAEETKPTVKPKQGSITLKKATGEGLIIVSLDSMGFDVVGYDIILAYDPQQLEIVQVSSILPEFTLFKIKRENYMVITGAKKPSATAQTVLTNKDLINLTVKPKISGTISLNIIAKQDKETTKFVDAASVVHYPNVN